MIELEKLCEKHGVDIDINLDRARIHGRMRDCGLPNLYRNQFKDFTESTTLWEDADND
ncbi:MAG: hypothetical protein IPI97_14345 [Nitrosomonas sp.]|nr:hypothetical protein [Nitrosomonas sp.]